MVEGEVQPAEEDNEESIEADVPADADNLVLRLEHSDDNISDG